MATTNWGRLTVVDLRHELKQRGLSTAGRKADLVERLTTAENEQVDCSPPNDRGTEAEMAVDTYEATNNDVKYQENLPEADSGVADKPASVEMSQLGEELELVRETAPIVRAEPLDKSELFDDSERVEDSQQATESNPIPESEHIENPKPAAEPESTKKPKPVTNSDAVGNPPPAEWSGPIAKSELAGEPELIEKMESQPMDSATAQLAAIGSAVEENNDDAVPTMEADEASPDLSRDVRGRKRRSRTPPPSDDESSRKRTRSEQHIPDESQTADDPAPVGEEVFPLDDDPSGKDSSYAKLLPDIPTEFWRNEGSQGGLGISEKCLDKIEPSIHPPTSALYIRNLMRPLKEKDVRDWLAEHATPEGRTPNDNIIRSFFLDRIRSHVFVEFGDVAAAEGARAKIHAKIWPEESTRKALWADFIPPERIPDWVNVEERESSRGDCRWELIYEEGEDGEIKLEHLDGNDPKNKPRLMGKPKVAVPTGPSRQFSGVSGPRGKSALKDAQAGGSRATSITTAIPDLTFTPVSHHVVQQRLHNLRGFRARHENYERTVRASIQPAQKEQIVFVRYTLQFNEVVVSRGPGNSMGARRPDQPRRRDRNRGPHRPRGGDRYIGSGRRRFPDRDVPRSRFNNAPLPTFRGGGGGGRGPRPRHSRDHRR